ncbi:MAG TPA: DNA-formamidopyrimidine glycosylase family protein [Candidatus Limnocylindrales bacterium]
MPEGDTLHRTAAGLAPYLVGRPVTAARARAGGGPKVERIVGATIESVEANGKNLLIRFDNGLELRTHLRMTGSWHRYRPGERWRRPPARARLVLEVPGAVAVCFDAPVIELFDGRAEAIHPTLARLGPDLLSDDWGPAAAAEAHRRLRDPARAALTISEALLDQRALAGIGNIWRNETLFAERVNPWTRVADVDDETLDRLIARARDLLRRSVATRPGGMPMLVYRRAGRPCRRCGTLVRSAPLAAAIPRTTYWCPACQPDGRGADDGDRRPV